MRRFQVLVSACGVIAAMLLSPTYVSRVVEAVSPSLGLLVMVVHPEPFAIGVHAIRLLLVAAAALAFARPRRFGVGLGVGALLPTLLLIGGALWVYDWVPKGDTRRAAQRMAETEAVLVGLTPQLIALDDAVADLALPNRRTEQHFTDEVTWTGALGDVGPPEALPLGAVATEYALGPAQTLQKQDVQAWASWLQTLYEVDHAHFAIEDGTLSDDRLRFVGRVLFAATARTTAGPWNDARGVQTVTWERASESDPWRIRAWEQRSFRVTAMNRRLFADDLRRAIPDEALRARVQRSIHEEHVLRAIQHPELPDPHPWFQVPSADRHPGIAVVDIEGDGDDDLYVMARWGTNVLLRNRGDGTFESAEAELGLDITDHSAAAVFADFDNDGDRDLFLGRTLAPSLYLVNDNGRFVDRTETLLGGTSPAFVSSVAAADVDQDGLLDLYVATFAIDATAHDAPAGLLRGSLLPDLLSEADARDYHQRFFSDAMHPILANVGPPNVLLKNQGDGRFARMDDGPQRLFRNTYQASFGDVDGDGDPDLYCANDVAENTLFINEGGRFVDATAASRTADIGFGMGVSFGDYDRDGDQDLYVTNMYSKAGKRITSRLERLDPRFAAMAGGNTLFRNDGDHFSKVSGVEPPALLVEKAGWGWGGQFVDLDSDGHLDLYALSGYFTAPPEVALPVDT